MNYEFATEPLKHQLEEWQFSRDMPARGILWDPGTGKSKLAIDNACWLAQKGEVDCLLVIAPNGVHRNWVMEEIPKHLPKEIAKTSHSFFYQSSKSQTKWHAQAVREAIHHDGFLVFTMSYDAVMTDKGKTALWLLLKTRKPFYVLDESHRIKTPGSKRTKRIVASGKYAKYKRILTGTPITNGPFDIFSQIRFLDEEFWKQHGINTFQGFKTVFGIWQKNWTFDEREYDQLLGYQNVEQLKSLVSEMCGRVSIYDIADLPSQNYVKHGFELTNEQRRLYNELKEDFITWIDGEGGGTVSAALTIVRLLRLQQISCGYVPVDPLGGEDANPIKNIGKQNPRLDLYKELTEDCPTQALSFARFTRDVDLIMDIHGKNAARYDGKVNVDDRVKSLDAFKAGDVQFLVGKARVLGEGLTLNEAKHAYFYSQDFNFGFRLQAERRLFRIGQTDPVLYHDLCGDDTVDAHIIKNLRRKFDISTQLTGDMVREWL